MTMTTEQIESLVVECQFRGRSFASVRREHGDDVYRA